MKTILTTCISVFIVIHITSFTVDAQCTSGISGDTCINALLTASFSGGSPASLEWYRDGALQQIRTKRNPNFLIVAGNGTTSAGMLVEPRDIFVDASGNMYIVDGSLYSVIKWAPGATEGVVVAGGNGKGTSLNQFFTPQSVVVDNAGNVYVSDDLMARVTKWAPGATSGVVVAGGNGEGSAANQLFGPQNICMDAAGNLYIADRWNDRIQKWAPGATTGTTVAGGNGRGSAANQFSEPLDVGVDASGNIYVVDYSNNRVQKWAPGATTGVTVAGGNGAGYNANQFSFTTAMSVSANGTVYVRDQGNYRIQKWTPGATAGITLAGGNGYGTNDNQMGWGFGLFADNQENIYVPELFLKRVDKFVPSPTADMQIFAYITGKYSVLIKGDNGCNAQSGIFSLSTFPAQPSAIRGPQYVSGGQQNIIYKVQKVPGLIYNWSVPPDATIVAGQGNYAVKVNWGFTTGLITVTASNSCGQSAVRKKRVNVMQPSPVIVNTTAANMKLIVSPNPVIQNAVLQFVSPVSYQYHLTLCDMSGRTIMQKNGVAVAGQNNISLSLENIETGTYLITITDNENRKHSLKIIKG